jgi:hypothetical protein
MERLITSADDSNPGAASPTTVAGSLPLNQRTSPTGDLFDKNITIKENLKLQEKNQQLCDYFHLPITETLFMEFQSTLWTRELSHLQGQCYLSQNYYCFASKESHSYTIVIPFYCIKKLEKVSKGRGGALANAITITTYENRPMSFSLGVDREKICDYLKEKLMQNAKDYRYVRAFALPAPDSQSRSETVVLKIAKHGFGFAYGFLIDVDQ